MNSRIYIAEFDNVITTSRVTMYYVVLSDDIEKGFRAVVEETRKCTSQKPFILRGIQLLALAEAVQLTEE